MLTSKVFHRKTKKGSIIKIVREHYLREDIPCGRRSCGSCRPIYSKWEAFPHVPEVVHLDDDPRRDANSASYPGPHYLLPDANVVLQQMDVIEDPSFGNDIIILQTVLNEVRVQNLNIFTRIKGMAVERRLHVFCNEYHKDTFMEREPGETTGEYNERLVRVAAKWFAAHFEGTCDVVLLLNNEATHKKAKDADLTCCLFSNYVKGLKDNLNLLDKVVDEAEEGTGPGAGKKGKILYPEYLALSTLHSGVKKGTFFQGKFQSNRENYLEGFVGITLKGEDTMVLIQGRDNINRAIHEDVVVIELFPESEWGAKSELVLPSDADVEKDSETQANKEKSGTKRKAPASDAVKRPTAKVVGVIKRNWRQYCGVLREKSANLPKSIILTSHLFVPSERRVPIIRVETRQYETLRSQRIMVAIDSWPRDSRYPKGHYIRALGTIGDKETENEVLLLEHDVPYHQFTPAVLKCLPSDPDNYKIPEDEISRRKDLRGEWICSVDPPGCTDIDDALHCKDLGNEMYEVGVHIADVSYYVKPNTALDIESGSRGTTVYLVDRRIDMIPTVLSSNLCSLLEARDRLTFSVIWKVDKKSGQVLETNFAKSVIRSRAALTYAEAQLRIDSREMKDELTLGLRRLNTLAKILKKTRLDKGALVLANPGEIRFVEVESETHDNVTEIESKQIKDTNSMVEEFMLLANISVAEKLYHDFPELALLRRHPKPSQANFEELVKAAKTKGFDVDVSSGKGLANSLDSAQVPSNEYFNLMLRMITTRCMTQAVYFCSGTASAEEANFNHFGLAAPIYTHFTSPIRRYADLIVHRLLSFSVGASALDSTLLSRDKMQDICDNINYRHKKAQYANRASVNLHTLLFIKNAKRVMQEKGYVLFVRQNALQIFIPRIALEVTYFVEETCWSHDPEEGTQTHLESGAALRQFDPVVVQLGIKDKSTEFRRGNERVETLLINPPIDTLLSSAKKQKV